MFAAQNFVFFVMTAVASTENIIWNGNSARKCDFSPKDDFQSVRTLAQNNCPDICARTYGCTHYVWSTLVDNGTCYLKHDPYVTKHDAYISPVESAVCGIHEATVKWNDNSWTWRCEFPKGGDIASVPSVSGQCEHICATNQRCTHFNWSLNEGGTCYLKHKINVSRDDAVKSPNKSTICGIINRSTTDPQLNLI